MQNDLDINKSFTTRILQNRKKKNPECSISLCLTNILFVLSATCKQSDFVLFIILRVNIINPEHRLKLSLYSHQLSQSLTFVDGLLNL